VIDAVTVATRRPFASDSTGRRIEASVIVPCFNNERTLARCLEALRRQSFAPFETVVVDSSPGDDCEGIVRDHFPEVRYEHTVCRLLPHAARNRATESARGDLLVFTDADTYADETWLEMLVASHRATGHITVGAVACYGRRWIDVGNHICKFSKWLPAGRPRAVDNAPTANLLCPRGLFDELGRFDAARLHADTSFSWLARDRGHVLWFEPKAIVYHHHLQGLRELVRERHTRGVLYGDMRADRWGNSRSSLLLYLVVSLLPVRFVRILGLTVGHCWRARCLADLAATHPVVALGHAASLLGECRSYARHLVARHSSRDW
jgi:glycosyltransferase involved in cell wall biosynthesis